MLAVLERMGARVGLFGRRWAGGEPVADIEVRQAELVATEVEPELVPSLIDELPLIVLVASFARGTTVIRGAGELRVKESDRIATVVNALRAVGAPRQGAGRRLPSDAASRPGCGAAGSTPRATTGSRCWAPSPGSARSRAW